MKKFIFSACLMAVALCGFSQVGLKAGIGLSTMSLPNSGSIKWNTSYAVGIVQQMKLAPRVRLQTEMLYILKGYASKVSSTSDLKLEYLSLPILVNVKLPGGVSLLAGPEFSYLLKNNLALLEPNKFDAGASGGIGYQFSKVGFDIRYTHGFTNVFKNLIYTDAQGNTVSAGAEGKNRVVMFSAYVIL